MSAGRHDAVVLDFDGVLVESMDVKTRAFAQLYEPYGPAVVDKVIEYHLANGGVTRTAKFRYYHEQLLGTPLTGKMEAQLAERFSQLVEDAVVAAPPVAGANEFLQTYSGKVPLFVASGTPEPELRRIVQRRGLENYFTGVFGAPSTKAEILRRIAAGRGIAPADILMVGDARADYEGARAAGTAFVGRGTSPSSLFPPEVNLISDLTGLAAFV